MNDHAIIGAMSHATTPGDLARVLMEELPITQSLGIGVATAEVNRVVLTLPLAANRNHKGTVFAGSLNAVATLAGWSLLWVELRARGLDGHVVIQDATIRYLEPAHGDVQATCLGADPAEMDRAMTILARRGRARVALGVEVRDPDQRLVATLAGRYVIHRREVPGSAPNATV
ncbi:MAG: YiiD C-terminal domain-containing protein [Gemmatimonadales bacterium]|nr:YiiD C-terminal domain-containing protein [Gemmatimonadales bacterium]